MTAWSNKRLPFIHGFLLIVYTCLVLLLVHLHILTSLQGILLLGSLSLLTSLVIHYFQQKLVESLFVVFSRRLDDMINMSGKYALEGLEDTLLSKITHQIEVVFNGYKAKEITCQRDKDRLQTLICDVVHQLKTPLANLKLYEELLPMASTESERNEYLDTMHVQVNKLLFLFEAMTKVTRLDGGILDFTSPRQQLSIHGVCLTAIKEVFSTAKAKNIIIETDLNEDCLLNVHEKWTKEALFNILENAIKYSPPSTKVLVSTVKYELFYSICIKDQGPGMTEEQIPHIFKRFYRGNRNSEEDGAGLGLYLAREIIEKEGGYIKVSSTPKEGSVFSVFLPIPKNY